MKKLIMLAAFMLSGLNVYAFPTMEDALDVEGMANLNVDSESQSGKRRSNAPRDPFAASEFMLQEAGRFTSGMSTSGGGFLPSLLQKAPKMKRLGFITGKGKDSVALLEIEGAGIYQVRNGDVISLHSLGREEVINIRRVDSKMIEVQVGTVKQSIIVR